MSKTLVITLKFAGLRESGLLGTCGPQILSAAKDDTTQGILSVAKDDTIPNCHPERSEGSVADLWGITGKTICRDIACGALDVPFCVEVVDSKLDRESTILCWRRQ